MAEIVVTIGHNGGSVTAAPGDVIAVHLQENPTTGYRWQRHDEGGSAQTLAFVGDSFEISNKTAPGASGMRIFRFSAQNKGATSLQFTLVRSWQPDAPRETFHLHVEVT